MVVGDTVKVYEYVIRRLALMIFVLFGVSAIVFHLARGFPSASHTAYDLADG